MASLAPGNGWFPHRIHSSRHNGGAERQPVAVNGNVYAFPRTSAALASANRAQVAAGPAVATRLAALLLADSLKSGRTATWVLGWCFVTLVVAAVLWLSLAGALVAAALFYGVPWASVVLAATLIHALGAVLAVLMGRRIGRALLLSLEKRNQLARRAAGEN